MNCKSRGKGLSCKILKASCCWLDWKYHGCSLLFQHSLGRFKKRWKKPRNAETLKRQKWAFETFINEVGFFFGVWPETIGLYFKEMIMSQVTVLAPVSCPSASLLPSILLEARKTLGSPQELHACISSGGDPEQDEKQTWRLWWELEQIVQSHFTCSCIPCCHIFLLPTRNQLWAERGKARAASALLAGVNKAATLAKGRLVLHSAPLSWVHFWTPASSQLVIYYKAVMSSTQARCSSVCVCIFLNLPTWLFSHKLHGIIIFFRKSLASLYPWVSRFLEIAQSTEFGSKLVTMNRQSYLDIQWLIFGY